VDPMRECRGRPFDGPSNSQTVQPLCRLCRVNF
jgi:hypothetical protein